MASNHGNLYVTLFALVFGSYEIPHAKVNVMEYADRVEQGQERRWECRAKASGGVTGTGTEKGVGRHEHGGQRSP